MGSLSTNKKTKSASWFDVLKRSLKEVLRIDRSQLMAFQAIRGIIGIVIPLAVGQEPTSHYTDLELAQDLPGAADTLIGSVLILEAYLVDNPTHCALPMVSDFCNSVDEALRLIIIAIREKQPLTGFPNLQEALRRLQDRKSGHLVQDACCNDLRFVASEARRIVARLNGVRELLGGKRGW